jgi:hypothetical protein
MIRTHSLKVGSSQQQISKFFSSIDYWSLELVAGACGSEAQALWLYQVQP